MVLSLAKRMLLSALIVGLALAVQCGDFVAIASAHTLAETGTAHRPIGSGRPADPNIKYIGRWDTSSSTVAISYWPGAYFKTDFTGTTVKIKLGEAVNFFASIDHGSDIFYAKANGTVNLTPTPLVPGIHTLRVATYSEHDVLQFQGLILDAHAHTIAPRLSPQLVEFVGDSITAGATTTKHALSDYAWLVGEQLGVEHTQIAQGGICLTDGVQCGSPNAYGMSRQFFKLQTVYFTNSPDWDFSRYQAKVVVINLGTNDGGYHVSDATFEAAYVTFLQGIRAKYPHATILVMRTFKGTKSAPTLAAVQAVNAAGDVNVHYIDTTGWITSADTNDGVHPSDEGHVKIAKQLAPIVASFLRHAKFPRIK
jgi:lysophospholipase L1-like esterase